MKSPTAILTADSHLRDSVPICRTDDFLSAQERKFQFIIDLAYKYGVPILHAGDVFDKPKSSPWLEAEVIRIFTDYRMIAIPGNHDLPSHRIELLNHSSFGVLQAAKIIKFTGDESFLLTSNTEVHLYPWGTALKGLFGMMTGSSGNSGRDRIAIIHDMVTETKGEPWIDSTMGGRILRKAKGFKLILTGHNHKAFVIKSRGKLLVNPGSMMRTSADQIGYRPRVYLWDEKTNEVEAVYLPIEKGVIDRSHLDSKERRETRMSAFVERLVDDYEISLSFEKNLEEFFSMNKTPKSVRELIWDSIT